MRRIKWSLAATVSALVALSPAAASARCPAVRPAFPNSACNIVRLGWRIVDPGPPVRFRPSDGDNSSIEIAVTGMHWPKEDLVRWAEPQFSALGPLSDCRGDLSGKKVAVIGCTVTSGPGGPRKAGAMIVIQLPHDFQVVGIVWPDGADLKTQIKTRLRPLVDLVSSGSVAGISAQKARDALFGGREYYLAPGAGIPASAIEGVYHNWHWMPTFNIGMIDTGATYVLFKDGEAWRNPDAAPHDIDPAKFKKARPDDCGTWRRAGDDVVLTMNGKAEERFAPNRLIRYDPAAANQRIEGSWHSSLGGVSRVGRNTTITMASRSITLHADGRFERNGFSGASFSGPAAGEAFGKTAPTQRGRYRIDGYTLELNYDDGRKDRSLFYWAGGPKDRYAMVFINGVKFLGGVSR